MEGRKGLRSLDILFDDLEQLTARHVCLVTETNRYDFSVHYSQFFCGKSMITCLQSGTMLLMSYEDIFNDHVWVTKFRIHHEDLELIKEFFKSALPPLYSTSPQY
ncbi:SAV0927 family protein [Polycladomyces subterraneus]|uniref:SAV0927 family protein n=1 Tax=Polycladomyces subterraneus TaxID=1016997 RepID=UPI00343E922A